MVDAARARHQASRSAFTSTAGSARAGDVRRGERHFQREIARIRWSSGADTSSRRSLARCARHARICVQHADHLFGSGEAPGRSLLRRPVSACSTCSERLSRRVALLHDYPLYEFTIIVRPKRAWRSCHLRRRRHRQARPLLFHHDTDTRSRRSPSTPVSGRTTFLDLPLVADRRARRRIRRRRSRCSSPSATRR